MIKACIFDLDGTLADTLDSMAYVTNIIMEKFGLKTLPVDNFRYYSGEGANMLIRRALKDAGDPELAHYDEGQKLYREMFEADPMYKVVPYEGMPETLKELKKIVKVADVEKRIPSVKSLKEHKVVVKEMINADTTISVYDHGYILYTAGNQSTVFPLHSCDDYEYVSVTGDNKEFNKEFFDNENWYIRLLMEAEDRMAYSQSKISTNHGVFSNSDVTDDAEIMRGSSKDFVDDVIDREILNALIKELTERQKTVLNLIYFEEMRQQDVADYLGIKQQSVNDLLNRALKTMKKKAENEEF